MVEERVTTPPVNIGVDIPPKRAEEIWSFIVARGKEDLAGTAFLGGKDFAESDIDALKSFYQEVFNYQEKVLGPEAAVFNKSLQGHLLLSDRYAEEIAPYLDINPYRLRALALTHDFGRLFSHRRGRNDAIGAVLERKFGFDEKFIRQLPVDTLWTDIDPDSIKEKLSQMTTGDAITAAVLLIDVLAKWDKDDPSKLRRFEDVTPLARSHQHQPDASGMWPSEYKRQLKITSVEGNDSIQKKYDFIRDWFEAKSGTKVNDFIERVEDNLKLKPLKTSWI